MVVKIHYYDIVALDWALPDSFLSSDRKDTLVKTRDVVWAIVATVVILAVFALAAGDTTTVHQVVASSGTMMSDPYTAAYLHARWFGGILFVVSMVIWFAAQESADWHDRRLARRRSHNQ